MNQKNVYLLSPWSWNDFIPVLWPSAKTYYELHGSRPDQYRWVNPACEALTDLEDIKHEICKIPPDIFGVSLYVWNYEKTLELCRWVKHQWPHCLIITGGPHQYFKHHKNWFSKHAFLDASLPSEVYGEIAITDILDNLRADNTVDWNLVEQMRYPSRDRTMILHSSKATYKRDFKWNYSAFACQRRELDEYVKHFRSHCDRPLHCKIETTRGCPYECTFCDWGGGVGTKVIAKSLESVKQDLDVLLAYDVASIYVCDANFGINGDRDVSIVQYLADRKRESTKPFPYVQYGGFAKTNRHFDYLKQIFTIEAENNMSYVYKISQQTFDLEILNDIKRTDLRSNEHWDLAQYLRKNYAYDASVELIMGLPGMTLSKWYKEFDKPFDENVIVRAYPWHLLPEAESYSPEYRQKFGLGTAQKRHNNSEWIMPSEIVVEASSYSRQDYCEMMVVYAIYMLFTQSGIYRNSIKYLLKNHNSRFSDFLQKFHTEVYAHMRSMHIDSLDYFEKHLLDFVSPDVNSADVELFYNQQPQIKVTLWNYLLMEIFHHFEKYAPTLDTWFENQGVPKNIVHRDSRLVITNERLGTTMWSLSGRICYDNFKDIDELVRDLDGSTFFIYGNILNARKRLPWI